MKTETRWISFAGVGALALVMAAGCSSSDQTGTGETSESPAANGAAKIAEGAKEIGNAAANSAAKGGEKVANAASDAGKAVANAASNATNAASNAASNARNAASNSGKAVTNAAAKAGQATSNAAHNAAAAAKNLDDAAKVTPLVKTALGANAALKGSNIDVTTTDKDVSLDGTVKNAAQKSLAGNIAKAKAPGYTIKNNLKIG